MTLIMAKRGLAAATVASLLLLAGEGSAQRDKGDLKTVKGTIRSFTEAPKGERDGAILSDGTVIHWPPHLADRFTAVAKKGDRVEVTGRYETLEEGEKVFEARTITNVRTKASFTNDDEAPPPPKGKKDKKDKKDRKGKKDRDDFEDDPKGKDGPAGLDRRLRRVEDKLDRLIEELRRSRGEKLRSRPTSE